MGAYRVFNCDGCPCTFCTVFVCFPSMGYLAGERQKCLRTLMGRAANGLRAGEGGLSFWGLAQERSVFSQKNKTAGLLLSCCLFVPVPVAGTSWLQQVDAIRNEKSLCGQRGWRGLLVSLPWLDVYGKKGAQKLGFIQLTGGKLQHCQT